MYQFLLLECFLFVCLHCLNWRKLNLDARNKVRCTPFILNGFVSGAWMLEMPIFSTSSTKLLCFFKIRFEKCTITRGIVEIFCRLQVGCHNTYFCWTFSSPKPHSSFDWSPGPYQLLTLVRYVCCVQSA